MESSTRNLILETAKRLACNYEEQKTNLPDRKEIYKLITDLFKITFPEYFATEVSVESLLTSIYERLCKQIKIEETQILYFLSQIPKVQELLIKDVEATIAGDPAAQSREEVILAYPGLFAIFVYRFAHILYELKVPMIPRIMSEYAHGKTGIDINPGAVIGEYFFIDHGTGIVIGETAVIGNYVRIYQGVTIGALSTRKGQALAGKKRHPTIEDHVIIYANATILGGDTVVGKNVTVAGNTFVTESIPEGAKVSAMLPELVVRM